MDLTLDPDVLLTLRRLTMPGEPDVLCQVLTAFVEDVPRRLEALARAATAGSAADAARVGHSLKGSAATIGARRLRQLAQQVEEAARDGELDRLRAGAAAVRQEFTIVESEIHRILAGGAVQL